MRCVVQLHRAQRTHRCPRPNVGWHIGWVISPCTGRTTCFARKMLAQVGARVHTVQVLGLARTMALFRTCCVTVLGASAWARVSAQQYTRGTRHQHMCSSTVTQSTQQRSHAYNRATAHTHRQTDTQPHTHTRARAQDQRTVSHSTSVPCQNNNMPRGKGSVSSCAVMTRG